MKIFILLIVIATTFGSASMAHGGELWNESHDKITVWKELNSKNICLEAIVEYITNAEMADKICNRQIVATVSNGTKVAWIRNVEPNLELNRLLPMVKVLLFERNKMGYVYSSQYKKTEIKDD